MRRKDREVTDAAKIREIIEQCHCCRVGFSDGGNVYIVPLSFGCCIENGQYTLYFHSAKEGRKIELLKTNPMVGFEMDTGYRMHSAETACGHSAAFQSIIGTGKAELVTEPDEKQRGLSLLMLHETGKSDWEISPENAMTAAVFKIIVTELSCKIHL